LYKCFQLGILSSWRVCDKLWTSPVDAVGSLY